MQDLRKYIGVGGAFRYKHIVYAMEKKGCKISRNYLCELVKGSKPLAKTRFEVVQCLADLFYNGSIDTLLAKNNLSNKKRS